MFCVRCGGSNVVFEKTIMQSGATAIGAYCQDCDRRATNETWLSKSRFTAEQIASMPIHDDYTGGAICQYEGCNGIGVEWNHYAPRYLFGADCEHWPIGPLCVAHHRTWHAGLEGKLMTHCPNCRAKVESTAIVAAFLDDPQWSFWGEPGARGIVCQAAGYVHFRVTINGRRYHRLAQITKAAQVTTPAPQPTEKPLPALPLFEPRQEEWLP